MTLIKTWFIIAFFSICIHTEFLYDPIQRTAYLAVAGTSIVVIMLWHMIFKQLFVAAVLKHAPEKVLFHYVDHSITPDMIEVWVGRLLIMEYAWISGEDSHELSLLGFIHSFYRKRAWRTN